MMVIMQDLTQLQPRYWSWSRAVALAHHLPCLVTDTVHRLS
jgi:hypothetical protein